jgi:hypothetical protein
MCIRDRLNTITDLSSFDTTALNGWTAAAADRIHKASEGTSSDVTNPSENPTANALVGKSVVESLTGKRLSTPEEFKAWGEAVKMELDGKIDVPSVNNRSNVLKDIGSETAVTNLTALQNLEPEKAQRLANQTIEMSIKARELGMMQLAPLVQSTPTVEVTQGPDGALQLSKGENPLAPLDRDRQDSKVKGIQKMIDQINQDTEVAVRFRVFTPNKGQTALQARKSLVGDRFKTIQGIPLKTLTEYVTEHFTTKQYETVWQQNARLRKEALKGSGLEGDEEIEETPKPAKTSANIRVVPSASKKKGN